MSLFFEKIPKKGEKMDLNRVYIAGIYKVENTRSLISGLECSGVYVKTALVYEKERFGKLIYIDLDTKEKYKDIENTRRIGDLYVEPYSLISVKKFVGQDKESMSRKELIKTLLPQANRNNKDK